MPDSEVIRVMRSFKRGLLADERQQQLTMSRAWLSVERRLSGDMAALAAEMHDIAEGGGVVSSDLLFDHRRYRLLMRQLTDELGIYTRYADRTITDRQAQLARLGIDHAVSAIETQGVRAGFARLPVEAVERMVGLAGNGSPLRTLLTATWPDAAQGMTSALIQGVSLGYNPRRVARMMAQGSTRALDRMLTISRTEILRTYRQSSLDNYRANRSIVRGHKRIATFDSRVCPSCLMDSGTFYELDEDFATHPNCRCASIPVLFDVPDPSMKSGVDWFREQPQKTQQSILGKGRYEAYNAGRFGLEEVIKIVPNQTWGDTLQVASLQSLIGA